jgi:hypothetical protein
VGFQTQQNLASVQLIEALGGGRNSSQLPSPRQVAQLPICAKHGLYASTCPLLRIPLRSDCSVSCARRTREEVGYAQRNVLTTVLGGMMLNSVAGSKYCHCGLLPIRVSSTRRQPFQGRYRVFQAVQNGRKYLKGSDLRELRLGWCGQFGLFSAPRLFARLQKLCSLSDCGTAMGASRPPGLDGLIIRIGRVSNPD